MSNKLDISGYEMMADDVILTLPATGLRAKRADGTLDTVLSWNAATGDMAFTSPVGTDSGGGTRRITLSNDVNYTDTHGIRGSGYTFYKNLAGNSQIGVAGEGTVTLFYTTDTTSLNPNDVRMGGRLIIGTPGAPSASEVLRVGGAIQVQGGLNFYTSGGTWIAQMTHSPSSGAIYLQSLGIPLWLNASGQYVIVGLTDLGTVGLLRVAGAINAGSYSQNGYPVVAPNVAYTQFVAPTGNATIQIGGTGDPSIYYDTSSSHRFRHTSGSVVLMVIDGYSGAGGTTMQVYVNDASALRRINATAAGVAVPAGKRTLYTDA